MRKIVTTPHRHNRAARACVLLLPLCLLAACGDRKADIPPPPAQPPCAVTVNDQALQQFYAVADARAAGKTVGIEDLGNLAAAGPLDLWRRSFAPENVTPAWVGRMLFLALVGEDELPDRYRDKPVRMDLVLAYREALARRAEIQQTAADLMSGDVLCRVRGELEPWLVPGALPDTLRVDLLVGYPEIRLFEGHVLLDGGLAWAAGREQLPRFVAAIVYKDLGERPGRAPRDVTGDAIVLETLRLVTNLIPSAMIERTDQIVFDKRHSLLSGAAPSPESICDQAYRTLASLDLELTRVRQLARPTDEDWLRIYRLFVGAQSWQASAWYMGQVIDARLGRERLQAATHHPADLLAAYQEASLMHDGTSAADPQSVRWYLDQAPAFTADNARWLDERLRAYFR
ncbi:MAG: hypothetical protein R3D98_02725 [Candidatus Krumholzibacteriia bacterium]